MSTPLEELPQKLWVKVVEAVNSVLEGHRYYGFAHFNAYADPSIDVILERSKLLGQILGLVIDSPHIGADEFNNLLINCQQCIHLIQRTHASLKCGDQDEYESCIAKLDSQRKY
jgi:hypothetical protein